MFNHHTSNKTIVFTLLFITLFIGFFFNENSSGGALPDFLMRIEIINSFHNDFIGTFLNYNQYSDRHSPLILILITTLLKSGLDFKEGQNAIFIEAENCYIVIKATDGNIRFEGDKIDFVARQEFNVESHGKIDINAQNINIDARARMRITARQFLLVDAPCGMQILSKIIQGVSAATDRPSSYLSTGG